MKKIYRIEYYSLNLLNFVARLGIVDGNTARYFQHETI